MSMTDPAGLDPAVAEAAARAMEAEQKKGSTDLGGAGDVIGGVSDVAFSGAGEMVGDALGAAVEVTGTIVSGAFEIAGSIIGGIFEL